MSSEFDGFQFKAINYDSNKHKWDDVSKQPLRFQSIKFDFNQVELEVRLSFDLSPSLKF